MAGDEGGYGAINSLALAVAWVSCPAKTVAKTVAERYLSLSGELSDINLDLAHIEYFQNIAVYYVFNINSQGHIIIAADDRFDPIRAFIPNNIYSPESITFNPGFLWFSNSYWKYS